MNTPVTAQLERQELPPTRLPLLRPDFIIIRIAFLKF